jgi:uncharacterized damage-inducible protein DinB
MTIAQSLLSEFERELPTTRRFLERIPADKLNWKPHPKSMSAGQLALHIAQTPLGVLNMVATDTASPPDMTQEREAPTSVASILKALDESADFVRKTLPTWDDRRMAQNVAITVQGRTVMSAPREVLVRNIMLNHVYHHRGQLGVYLRLLGAQVPASYGPSGDESPF